MVHFDIWENKLGEIFYHIYCGFLFEQILPAIKDNKTVEVEKSVHSK